MKRQGIAEVAARRHRRGDGKRPPRLLHRRGHRRAGRLGRRVHGDPRSREEFPDRMLNTPIAELGFFGVATGAAIMGMRPIVDVQYGDFLFLARTRSSTTPPSCATCPAAQITRADGDACADRRDRARRSARPEHGAVLHRRPRSQGRRPSNAYDAKGLLKAAVRDDNPVMIFEHKLLYGSKGARAEPGAVDATSDIPDERLHSPAARRVGAEARERRDHPRLAPDGPFRAAQPRSNWRLKESTPK